MPRDDVAATTRSAVLSRLSAIAQRDLADRTITPGEADVLLGMDEELSMARRALWLIYVACGEDTDGNDRWHCSTEAAASSAVAAVEQLRSDYNEAIS